MADKRFRGRDKIVQKMTKDGLVEENLRTGETKSAVAEEPPKQEDSEKDAAESAEVLAEISCASNGCEEDGLEPYVEDVLDTFLQAITTRKVKNLPQYMKSLLWTSFATYKLNTISGITAPYKEVKNVYGLH